MATASKSSVSLNSLYITKLPMDVQVNILTYLRAFDLAAVQQTCTFYANSSLVHKIVCHTAEVVYPIRLTLGFEKAATSSIRNDLCYTYEHLRNMELLVVARVLNSPEPATGYIVSKSWCKTALKWLEANSSCNNNSNSHKQQQHRSLSSYSKKLSKKKERVRTRRLSDVSPPWPNVNIDLLCPHANLQHCSNTKSIRARRRILDKQAWKILKKLYPDSTQLNTNDGTCLLCRVENETMKRQTHDDNERARSVRKKPLENMHVRRFYTRRSGIPIHAVKAAAGAATLPPPDASAQKKNTCPLIPGLYYVLPREWCYEWRKYVKTGECSNNTSISNRNSFAAASCGGLMQTPPPPDAAVLLCDAHRLARVPPHLERFLYGQTSTLFLSSTASSVSAGASISHNGSIQGHRTNLPVGVAVGQGAPDPASVQALREAGLGAETHWQWSAMRQWIQRRELQQQHQQQYADETEGQDVDRAETNNAVAFAPRFPFSSALSKNDLLDLENHAVVEILTQEEYIALQDECPYSATNYGCFVLSFTVNDDNDCTIKNDKRQCSFVFSTPPCKQCDATGRASFCDPRQRVKKTHFISWTTEFGILIILFLGMTIDEIKVIE